MVSILPPGAIVVVPTTKEERYMRDLIRHLRGEEFSKNTEIRVINHASDIERLRGLRRPIHVDHHFYEAVSSRVADELDAFIAACGGEP